MERLVQLIARGGVVLDALESAEKVEKRDYIEDSRRYLKEKGIVAHVDAAGIPNRNIPLVIVPNHFSRVHFDDKLEKVRKRIFATTGESFRSTGLATVYSGVENVRWVIKHLPNAKLPNPERMVQNSLPDLYGFIPVYENATMQQNIQLLREIRRTFKDGKAIGFYPQATPNPQLEKPHSDFVHFLKVLNSTEYQIWPVSIDNPQDNDYFVFFGPLINSRSAESPEDLAHLTLATIAKALPEHLRGPYLEAPTPQQPVSGQIQLPREQQLTSGGSGMK